MEDNFNRWNSVKKQTNKKVNNVYFKEREIFWLRLGQNIGNEEYGKGNEFQRPVLIVRRLTATIFVGVPLTSTLKDNDYFHKFEYNTKKEMIENSAMILQLRTFDKNRLMTKIGMINKNDFENIKNKISRLFIPSKE